MQMASWQVMDVHLGSCLFLVSCHQLEWLDKFNKLQPSCWILHHNFVLF